MKPEIQKKLEIKKQAQQKILSQLLIRFYLKLDPEIAELIKRM